MTREEAIADFKEEVENAKTIVRAFEDNGLNNKMAERTIERDELAISALTADVRPNIHGHWIATPECDTCSECHFKVVAGFNFCPNCGADMRKPERETGQDD